MPHTQHLQECINECESALSHLDHAMDMMENEQSKQKLEHASQDLNECIRACENEL
ncbi:hypothetical protein [Virgibacillus alimentarius]|uniref:Uncharacterized protein n=1 Tax=Virgibacillus alimentarius TaxID=698769 RepID=A0ABS4S9H8_9BACI|nr:MULTISPECIES: hypothetical protein [Virgibacillus]MBP2258069.1 hypothetical protein [Virgibacillus alimentarius]HLR67079.1 hypothetical protein [Virgibacillus sp.]